MKDKLITSTLILLIGGFITKALGMLIKIIMTRLIGTEGIGLFMMILPTMSLFIILAQMGLPVAFSKLVAEDTKNNKKLYLSALPISLLVNIVLMIIIVIIAPFLSNTLLHDKRCIYAVTAISLIIPLTTLSSISRSYFFGKQKMLPHVISNIIEDLVRLILIVIGVPLFIDKGLEYALCYIVLTNIGSELASTLVLIFFLPKNIKIRKDDLKPNRLYLKEELSIAIPNTTGRLIGSIGYFLEPIILTSSLLYVGYTNNYIITEYGIISGYVLPLLLLPSFFTLAISQALLPVVTKLYINKKYKETKRKIYQGIFFSLIIGIPVTTLLVIFPEYFLKLIYNTTKGVEYLRILAPFILFQYIQAPLSFSLDAMGKSTCNMKAVLVGTTIRSLLLYLLSFLHIGIYSLIISTIINILVITFYNLYQVNSNLN